MSKPSYVYVASSWRCPMQRAVVQILKACDVACYDFRNPEDSRGFSWSEVMPGFRMGRQAADIDEFLTALDHPRAIEGFQTDMKALDKADTCILVLPCGKSAHLELGYAIGKGKKTAVLLTADDNNEVQPELMYKAADLVTYSMLTLLAWLGVDD